MWRNEDTRTTYYTANDGDVREGRALVVVAAAAAAPGLAGLLDLPETG